MKKFLSLAAGTALALSMFAGGEKASASSEAVNNSLQSDSFEEYVLESLRVDYPNAQIITPEESEQQQLINFSGVIPFASAPPLTYLEVYSAWSSNYGKDEYFSANQLSSNIDHGGEKMYIVTKEIGYGHVRNAKLDGEKLKQIEQIDFDINGDRIVDGVYAKWDASGYEGGKFTVSNISSNYPWNTMSDTINIK